MAAVVSLKAVVDELECVSDTRTAYLNRRTGELITVTDEDVRLVETGGDPDDFPEWEQELLPKLRGALESEDSVALPDSFEINEYSIMERFSLGVEDPRVGDELLSAIRGKGAFGRFRAVVKSRGIQDSWDRFRRAALEQIAAEWLERNGIRYAGAFGVTNKRGASRRT